MAEQALAFAPAARRYWRAAFAGASFLVVLLVGSVAVLLVRGLGIWGINAPVGWGFDIVNFVWWIGIAHAGTLISAILLLLRQNWRSGVHRLAETMTIVAIGCAALFPLLHLGRPWLFYWLLPYPNTMGTWPQFRSPLVWDFFAILTYGLVSLVFWYLGLLPDLAVLRDEARLRRSRIAWCLLALGWRGSARQWEAHRSACWLLAAVATPLVVSVHSVVSFDFAVSVVPGWHSTIFPPYFVAGAIFSGLAMLLLITVPLRALLKLEERITESQLDTMARVLLASGLVVTYGYFAEIFFAWYGGSRYEQYALANRLLGPYAPLGWALMAANVIAIQALWFGAVRRRPWVLFTVALAVSAGMWLERFLIVVGSLHRDYLPASWGIYRPTLWDWATLLGAAGWFAWLMLVLVRFLPVIPFPETRSGPRPAATTEDDPERAAAGTRLYGLAAVFTAPEQLMEAARRAGAEGYRRADAFSPAPVDGLLQALGGRPVRLSPAMFAGGVLGAAGGFLLQFWTSVIDMPLAAGGQPAASWQAFVPVTFECAVLGAAIGALAALAAATGLPQPHHAVFAIPGFERASRDRFFFLIEACDERFDSARTCSFLGELGALEVHEVRD